MITGPYLYAFVGVALAVLVIVSIVVTIFRAITMNRELLHTERMRAIETGQPLSEVDPNKMQMKYMHNAFWISFWTVFGIPASAFSAAASATRQIEPSLALVLPIWICAAAASLAATICATILMLRSQIR